MNKRTVLHADKTNEVYAPLFARYPHHLTLGDSEHGFFSCTLAQLDPDAEYEKMDLCDSGMEGERLYSHIVDLLDAGYMDAIEFTKEQAATMIGINQLDAIESYENLWSVGDLIITGNASIRSDDSIVIAETGVNLAGIACDAPLDGDLIRVSGNLRLTSGQVDVSVKNNLAGVELSLDQSGDFSFDAVSLGSIGFKRSIEHGAEALITNIKVIAEPSRINQPDTPEGETIEGEVL